MWAKQADALNGVVGQVCENVNDGVYVLDRDMRVVLWNRAARNITGYEAGEIIGSRCDASLEHCLADGRVLCRDACPMRRAMETAQTIEATVWLCHRDGHRMPVAVRIFPFSGSDGEVAGVVQVFSDELARSAVMRRLEELERLSTRDLLTGLRNRAFMQEQIGLRLAEMKRTGEHTACIFLDIDHFKSINDGFGHDAGDAVLRTVARTLACAAGPLDAVGRWGGEEFLMLLSGVHGAELVQRAESIRALIMKSRNEWAGKALTVTASIGATVSRPDDTAESLVRRADELAYRSKREGRNRVSADQPAYSTAA